MNDLISLLLTLCCFVVSFIYNKTDKKFVKKFAKSFLHTFYVTAAACYFSDCFYSIKYDYVEKHPNIPTAEIFTFLEAASMIAIPLIYIIAVLIVMKIDKKNDNKICQSNAKEEDIV